MLRLGRLCTAQVSRTKLIPGTVDARSIAQLTTGERHRDLDPLLKKGWETTHPRDAIKKDFVFKDFSEAWGFMSRVALRAEMMNHHPVRSVHRTTSNVVCSYVHH